MHSLPSTALKNLMHSISEMALAFQTVLDECENDNSIRCVYITGAGKAFCAGQDLIRNCRPQWTWAWKKF